MSKILITLSANAGVAIQAGGVRIWVDALHRRKAMGFSSVTPELQGKMLACEAFRNPDVICYTHCHPDHYSRSLTQAAQELWPKAAVIVPETGVEGWQSVTGQRWSCRAGDVKLTWLRLPHEGEQYANTVHYGILVRAGDRNILLPGDCSVASPVLRDAIAGIPVDTAVLDFPWITLARGRQFVEKVLAPSHIVLCHLPFARDDINGYRASAVAAAEKMGGKVHLLMEPLQSIEI